MVSSKTIYWISGVVAVIAIVLLVLAFTVLGPKSEMVGSGYTCRQQKISQGSATEQWDAVATSSLPNRHYQLFYPSVQAYTPYTSQASCEASIATFDSADYGVGLPNTISATYV